MIAPAILALVMGSAALVVGFIVRNVPPPDGRTLAWTASTYPGLFRNAYWVAPLFGLCFLGIGTINLIFAGVIVLPIRPSDADALRIGLLAGAVILALAGAAIYLASISAPWIVPGWLREQRARSGYVEPPPTVIDRMTAGLGIAALVGAGALLIAALM